MRRVRAAVPFCFTILLYKPRIKNVGAPCAMNCNHSSLSLAFTIAEAAIAPAAAVRKQTGRNFCGLRFEDSDYVAFGFPCGSLLHGVSP